MDSEWLSKVLSSYCNNVEQNSLDWKRTDLFFEYSEEDWFDQAAVKFRQHYLDAIRQQAVKLIDALQEQSETMAKALLFIEEAEVKKNALVIHFDDFSRDCLDEEKLVLGTKKHLRKTEGEVASAEEKMAEVGEILRQIVS